MKQTEQTTTLPLPENLEALSTDQLLDLRQQLRRLRDQRRIAINEEVTAEQTALRREAANARRIYDIEMNELKRQLDEIGDRQGQPAWRIKVCDLRERMSDKRYKFSTENIEREARDARLATDRQRRNAQNQLDYENAEIRICRVIRSKGGFREMGMHDQPSGIVNQTPPDNNATKED